MPYYFIDTSDGEDCIVDVDGLELADPAAARRAALDALPDMARDVIPDGDRRRFVVTVRDNTGRVLYSASLTLSGRWRDSPGVDADVPVHDA